ncbi:hypothetical protein DPMN_040832 [Dreissena polymorpha]|uniref:Uncharacterized protein n=1 Tax=Dreissena polymorpha TaxID=45954 RepID=A0A9D4HVE8_DREPO|nr:hypothetical protein DPMN_040832 [Dreissena polymorpha]
MFKCHCVEVNSFSLEITDFNKDDFLEFLLCCYPGTLKRLNINNVLFVVPIAHKYDVRPLVQESKVILGTSLTECSKTARKKLEPTHG